MKYEAILKNDKGEVIKNFQGEAINSSEVYYSNVPKDFRFPRVLRVRNLVGNEDFYGKLLPQVGKVLRLESDQINGVFNISLDNDEIVLKEVR